MNITMVLGIDFLKPYVDGRVYREARSLTAAGHKVTIICWARTLKNELLADEPVYEDYNGIKVKRVFSKISPLNSSKLVRIKQHLRAMKEIANEINRTETDVLHCHDFNTLFVRRYLKDWNKPLIYDSHEDFINMLDDVLPGYLLWYARRTERKMISNYVTTAITIAEPVAESLREYGASDVALVLNCRELGDYKAVREISKKKLRSELSPNQEIIVLYIGSIGRDRGLKDLVEVFKDFEKKKSKEEISNKIRLVLGGVGHLEDALKTCVSGINNIKWAGYVPGETLIKYNLASDIMLVLFNPARPSQRRTLPNKLFEAMAAEKPIIVCKHTEAGRIVEEENCGLTIPYGNRVALTDAIITLAKDAPLRKKLGKNGLEAAKRTYNWKSQGKVLIGIYDKIARKHKIS